jgi:hypothetical protein
MEGSTWLGPECVLVFPREGREWEESAALSRAEFWKMMVNIGYCHNTKGWIFVRVFWGANDKQRELTCNQKLWG